MAEDLTVNPGIRIRREQLPYTHHQILYLLIRDSHAAGDESALRAVAGEVDRRMPYTAEESMFLEELGYMAYRALNGMEP